MRYQKCVFAVATTLTVMSAIAQDSLEDLERRLEAAKKVQATEHAEASRKAEASHRADASRATMVIKVNGDCALSVNGDSLGRLTADKTRTVKVNAGEQLIECDAADGQRIETTERIAAGEQKVFRLSLSRGVASGSETSSDERFSAVADGVRDVQQNVIWAPRDNGANVNWDQATRYCSGLGSGWTLPAVAQLKSLIDPLYRNRKAVAGGTISLATTMIDLTGGNFWSSEKDSSQAWLVSLIIGWGSAAVSTGNPGRALCVRRF